MTLVDQLELPALDYTDPAMRGARFHTAMRELRAQGWLAAGPFGYVVLDREAGEFFLRTRAAIFPGMRIAELFDVRDGPLYEEMRHNILHIDGPDHRRLRNLVNPALSPRAVERYRPAMQRFLAALYQGVAGAAGRLGRAGGGAESSGRGLSAAVGDGGETVRCEFVEAFAKPYPSQVIATVMGAPLADAPRLHHWSNWIQRQFDAISMLEQRDGIERAVAEFYEYAWALLRTRREDPGEDLLSALIAASAPAQDGGASERLSEVECVNLMLNVLIGGVDTTQSQLAHGLRLFAEHPDQWALLAANPQLAGAAVEEVLRFEPITPFTARIVVEELTFRDVTFPEGTIVMVCAFTGNRDLDEGAEDEAGAGVGAGAGGGTGGATGGEADAEVSGDPNEFDIVAAARRSAAGGARVLTFGAGVHNCLGANLARLELREALAFLAPRMRNLELDGEPVYEAITGIYGLAELPLRFAA
jgi:cytochrome P450